VTTGAAFDEFSTAGAIDAATAAPVTTTFSDLEQFTLEAGVRQYVGDFGNGFTGIRPYVGATAGAVRTNDVEAVQSSAAFATAGNPSGVDAPIQILEWSYGTNGRSLLGSSSYPWTYVLLSI